MRLFRLLVQVGVVLFGMSAMAQAQNSPSLQPSVMPLCPTKLIGGVGPLYDKGPIVRYVVKTLEKNVGEARINLLTPEAQQGIVFKCAMHDIPPPKKCGVNSWRVSVPSKENSNKHFQAAYLCHGQRQDWLPLKSGTPLSSNEWESKIKALCSDPKYCTN